MLYITLLMRICKHIVYYYSVKTENRIDYLNQIIHEATHYPFETDIFIHTNQDGQLSIDNFQKNTNGMIEIIYHDLTDIHPWYLTWKYRTLMEKQKNEYDIFIYLEDDILIPRKALQYWFRYKERVMKDKYNLGFFRIEIGPDKQSYLTDIIEPMNQIVQIDDHLYACNLTNPYCGFWIYDKKEFNQFVNSKYWDIRNIKGYSVRASSAIGLHGTKTPWYKCTIVPVIDGRVHTDCKVYHIPNNYVVDKNNYFASMHLEKAVSF